MSDRFLKMGDVFWGSGAGRVYTVLGSCVSVIFWNPEENFGGMTHFLLPERPLIIHESDDEGPGRFGSDAIHILHRHVLATGGDPGDYRVRIFGGGSIPQDPAVSPAPAVMGNQNAAFARACLKGLGYRIESEDTGGPFYRKIVLDLDRGTVWVKRNPFPEHQKAG